MGKIKLLNTNNNGYFENNQLDISDNIPTEGDYNVGDIVIKATQVEHTRYWLDMYRSRKSWCMV